MVSHMFRMETGVDKERRDLLRSQLRAANIEASPALRSLLGSTAESEVPLHLWLLDEEGALAGGLVAHAWAHWLHVNYLWVDGRHRGLRLGARLLAEAERRAREELGCGSARVETWDFQAPDFYRKQGYSVVCEIPGYPPGVTEFTLTKQL
ncbi:GNAT family N-acetyltransferase [Streptomyces tsukubensis]|uniref:N-acetyltransferase n=1 Tax=Streptomyces tsukubensis TaxID=83656 RepID=A0A1V4A5P5_9ACTN|nr:GNAT family N-acetyltransferase [Streptomyces tsukubensis]OON75959.1 N-acetyltransferase [Streptomyces tsukubensis]QFR94052.1 GNAT family N-acetyltransferase [Streptomyces tsukubensis]